MCASWSYEEAQRALDARELFGMRFGLERMEALMSELGDPHRRFGAIQVLGTNGKSSTTRMTAAILEESGQRAGAYLSPHLRSWNERVLVSGAEIAPDRFAAGVELAAQAAESVDREAEEEVTQFELLTAAAFVALAEADVEVAVIEAGLGGRYDATSVVEASVRVLTNVGLEHTRWLGPTIEDIAREKLAACRPGSTLVLGDVPQTVREIAADLARERGLRLVPAAEWPGSLGAPGAFQRKNFGLAAAAAKEYLGGLDAGDAERAAGSVRVPGRFERVGERPLTIRDGAHNPAGIAALLEALAAEGALEGRVVAVVSILEDKDAGRMLELLATRVTTLICTANTSPRALGPRRLADLAREATANAHVGVEIEPDPAAAVRRARALAGDAGTVVITGSIHLIGDLAAGTPAGP